jgi:hypothetical protein
MNALIRLLPEPTKETTKERAIAALTALGVERSKISYDEDEFELRFEDNRFWLGNLLAQMRLVWPWQRSSVAHHFVASFLDKPDRPKTLEEARPHLLLGVRDSFMFEMLRLRSQIDGTPSFPPSGFALGSRLWLAGFLDSPNATSAVTVSDLQSWAEPWQRCYDIALQNLAARSTEGLTLVAEGVYHSPWHDCYDPARLLLRDVLARLELNGDPVAFTPNWNTCSSPDRKTWPVSSGASSSQ